jgi:hypothetical protein
MAWRKATLSASRGRAARKPSKKSGSNVRLGGNCQRTGPSFFPSAATPLSKKRRMGVPRLLHAAAGDRVARRLDAEDEAVGRGVAPSEKRLALLRAVEGGVYFDRGQTPAGVFELMRMGKVLRIEDAAPGREAPAADSDMDAARRHSRAPLARERR